MISIQYRGGGLFVTEGEWYVWIVEKSFCAFFIFLS